jgi:hypothetical protein
VFLGTNAPVRLADVLAGNLPLPGADPSAAPGPRPEPPEPGGNPPIPSAVPGRATDTAAGVAKALGGGHVEYTGDLAKRVHRYLLRSYPAKDVEWVLDPAIGWEYEPDVPLDSVNMARRPGGRNEDKVASIAESVESGASMDPVVLADFGEPLLRIADGFHRTLGVERAGKGAVPAFVGRHVPGQYRELVMGPMQEDSASVRKAHLAAWQRKSLHALGRGRSPAVPFESDAVPADARAVLEAALPLAGSPGEVRVVFAAAGGAL